MGLKAVILIDMKTRDVTHFIWTEKGEPPPFIPPKMIPRPRRGRPRKNPKPEVS